MYNWHRIKGKVHILVYLIPLFFFLPQGVKTTRKQLPIFCLNIS